MLNVKRYDNIKEIDNLEIAEGKYGKFLLLLMIAAVVCALFSDKIDMAVKGDKKVKKVIVIFSVGVLLVCTIAILVSILS